MDLKLGLWLTAVLGLAFPLGFVGIYAVFGLVAMLAFAVGGAGSPDALSMLISHGCAHSGLRPLRVSAVAARPPQTEVLGQAAAGPVAKRRALRRAGAGGPPGSTGSVGAPALKHLRSRVPGAASVQDRGHITHNPAHVDLGAFRGRRQCVDRAWRWRAPAADTTPQWAPARGRRAAQIAPGLLVEKLRQRQVFHHESTAGVDHDHVGSHAPDQMPTDEMPVARPDRQRAGSRCRPRQRGSQTGTDTAP